MQNYEILKYDMPILSERGIQKYIKYVSSIPNLDLENEKTLIHNFLNHKDIKAAQILLQSHFKLVVAIAIKFKNYGLPLVDLIAEGNYGLIQGIKKFRPEVGTRLSTYATWWIKATIQEYVIKSWSLVKIGTTAAQKKIFFNLNKVKKKILGNNCSFTNKDVTTMAHQLSVPQDELKDMMTRMDSRDVSLNTLVKNNDGVVSEMINIVSHNYPNQEMILIEQDHKRKKFSLLSKALEILNDRQRFIIEKRYMIDNPTTLAVIAQQFGISTERVRQIEEDALKKLKKHLELNDVFT